jgi:hypothetical protein
MSYRNESIEIKEPPVRRLRKRRSCVRRTCLTSCGCLLFFLIISIVLLKFSTTPRSVTLRDVPNIVKNNVPLYEPNHIDSIRVLRSEEQSRFGAAAFLPKAVLYPILLATDDTSLPASSSTWSGFFSYIQTPLYEKNHEQITISWEHLPVSPSFLYAYYLEQLQARGFTIVKQQPTKILFESNTILGTLSIDDTPQTAATDLLLLQISITPKR